jgi:hypothetical protein
MKLKIRLLTCLLASMALGSCVSGDKGGPADPQAPGPKDTATTDCSALEADACQASEACQTVRGSRVVAKGDGGHCLESRQVVGCIAAQICGEALTYFCDPEGQVHEVTNTCGPIGWSECPTPEPLSGECAP